MIYIKHQQPNIYIEIVSPTDGYGYRLSNVSVQVLEKVVLGSSIKEAFENVEAEGTSSDRYI